MAKRYDWGPASNGDDSHAPGPEHGCCRRELPRSRGRKPICGRQLGVPDRRHVQPDLNDCCTCVAIGGSHQGTPRMNNQCRCLSRRVVISFLASTIAWPSSPTVPPFMSKQANLQKSLQFMLLSLFGNLRSAFAIGTACLNSLPQETSTAEQLANEILAAASCDTEMMKSKETVRH